MGLPHFDVFDAATRQRIWRASDLGATEGQVVSTGHASLDAELPGGGWPRGAMTEVMQPSPESHAWQLLLPALVQAVQEGTGPVVLIGAPHEPFGPALAARGLPAEDLLCVRSATSAARSWGCEQALRCADVAAVLAWLPQARVGELRRLQLAAAQHDALLFVFRPDSMALSTSPAALRLRLAACEQDPSQFEVHLLKRRGPPLASPVSLPARSERMTALLAASQFRRKQRRLQQGLDDHSQKKADGTGATVIRLPTQAAGKKHALDRTAVAG